MGPKDSDAGNEAVWLLGQSVPWSTSLVLSKIAQQLLSRLPWNLVWKFMDTGGHSYYFSVIPSGKHLQMYRKKFSWCATKISEHIHAVNGLLILSATLRRRFTSPTNGTALREQKSNTFKAQLVLNIPVHWDCRKAFMHCLAHVLCGLLV